MKGRNPTADERRHMAAVRAYGCCVCVNKGFIRPYEVDEAYTVIHHVIGKTKPGAHFKVLPLCDTHHSRYKVEGLHYNLATWEALNGTQEELMEQVNQLVYNGELPEYLEEL